MSMFTECIQTNVSCVFLFIFTALTLSAFYTWTISRTHTRAPLIRADSMLFSFGLEIFDMHVCARVCACACVCVWPSKMSVPLRQAHEANACTPVLVQKHSFQLPTPFQTHTHTRNTSCWHMDSCSTAPIHPCTWAHTHTHTHTRANNINTQPQTFATHTRIALYVFHSKQISAIMNWMPQYSLIKPTHVIRMKCMYKMVFFFFLSF